MKLSIIIVNWNSWDYLEKCIQSILKSIKKIQDFEILVIDNNSVKDYSELISKISDKIIIYKSKENLGFPKANNFLIKKAKGSNIALVNPDVIINEEETFEKCIEILESDIEIGIIGTKVVDGNGKIVKFCARKFLNSVNFLVAYWYLSSFIAKINFLEKKCSIFYKSYDESRIVDAIHGGFMVIKKEVIDKIGLLDEKLPMYLEDIEFSFRAKKNGFKTYYFADKTIIHFTNKSSEKAPKLWIRNLAFQNNLEFLKLKYSDNYLILYSIVFLILFIVFYPLFFTSISIFSLIKKEKKYFHVAYLRIFDLFNLIRFIIKMKFHE